MWPNSQKTSDLVTFTEEILNGKIYSYSARYYVDIRADYKEAPKENWTLARNELKCSKTLE